MNETLALYDHLDALSRTRALSQDESLTLERLQRQLMHGPKVYGLRKELARRGLLRRA